MWPVIPSLASLLTRLRFSSAVRKAATAFAVAPWAMAPPSPAAPAVAPVVEAERQPPETSLAQLAELQPLPLQDTVDIGEAELVDAIGGGAVLADALDHGRNVVFEVVAELDLLGVPEAVDGEDLPQFRKRHRPTVRFLRDQRRPRLFKMREQGAGLAEAEPDGGLAHLLAQAVCGEHHGDLRQAADEDLIVFPQAGITHRRDGGRVRRAMRQVDQRHAFPPSAGCRKTDSRNGSTICIALSWLAKFLTRFPADNRRRIGHR
jgi:hypothetical protein